MLVIPAIDLRGGSCVRLQQGEYARETVYFDDPVRMAKLWRVMNAKVLHLVDLDAARTAGGPPEATNRDVVRAITTALDIPVQVGGGIRTLGDVEERLAEGAARVVLGTAAVDDPTMVEEAVGRFGASRIVVGIDARDGVVHTEGWEKSSGRAAADVALDVARRGVRRVVYTDVARDGTLDGPDVPAHRALAEALRAEFGPRVRITAAGGVGGYRDLLALAALEPLGVDSVVVGRALYENRFPCQQFWCWHRKEAVDLDRFSTAPFARSC